LTGVETDDSVEITRRGKPIGTALLITDGSDAARVPERRRSRAIDAGWRSLLILYLDTSPIVAALSSETMTMRSSLIRGAGNGAASDR
jgi:hypothetical protein